MSKLPTYTEFILERKKRGAKKKKRPEADGQLAVLTGSDGQTHMVDLDGAPVPANDMSIVSVVSVDAGPVGEGLQPMQTDWDAKDVKVGEYLYLTCMLRPRNASNTYTPNELGVAKVKVMDVYRGLQALKYAKK